MTRMSSRLAWSLWPVTVVMVAAAIVLSVAEPLVPAGEQLFLVLLPVFTLTSATVGALIASRHPRNAVGWIFTGTGLTWGLALVFSSIAIYAKGSGSAVTGFIRFSDWLGAWIFLPGIYLPATFLLLLFPNGRLPSRRWRLVAWASAAGIAGVTLSTAFGPGPLEDAAILRSNPYAVGDERLWAVIRGMAWLLGVVGVVGSVAALVLRFRRASGAERQQVKWLVYAGVMVGATFVLTGIGWGLAGDDRTVLDIVLPAITLFALMLIPVAAGVGILRHRLYDIDVVINRTVVYGVLAAFVTVVYVGIVVGIGALIGTRGNILLSIVATALIAMAFQPMRERARRLANRVVYGKRATPYEVMSEFADRVAGTYSLDEVLPRMARIAAEGTGASRVEVWVRVGDELRMEASWPTGAAAAIRLPVGELRSIPGTDRVIPVAQQDEILGAIAVTMPRRESLAPAEEKLLGDLASQAGLVLRNVRLIGELRASRQRLVAAQDQERRRIERNIHDGAQQQLVALSVKLRLLKTLAARDGAKADELIEQLRSEAQRALEDLRDLARGVYPPLLADKGLTAAVEAQARKAPVPVRLEANGVGRYPQEAEAAAYFCVLEALQNVAKYAAASRATVRLSTEDGDLAFSVEDDGRGFDPATTPRGSGLQNMADRVEALGGTVRVTSAPGRGTTVTGRIPVQPAMAAAQAAESRSGSNSDLGM